MHINTQHTYGPVRRSKLDLMGIRFINEPGDGTGAGGDAAAQAAAAAAGTGEEPKVFDAAYVSSIRAEAAANRVAANEAKAAAEANKTQFADFIKSLGAAAGFGAQEETDPAKLQAKVTDLSTQITDRDSTITQGQAAIKAANLSTAVAVLAHGLGGSARLLLANADFKTSIASVDPTDEAAITAKITAAIQANAALKTTPSSSGSSEHTGGQILDLEKLLAAAQKAGDVGTSISLKRRIAAAKRS
ncbi:hypothetical protein QMG61_05290 [Cryobacterium sp. PH31-AA6]|uniref:hypothetical protein n=1 Tax=Cryobacterium sp. PH31-AA6 TaxID=3046205 RepID=UPI0024B972F9|nr:hypothetical protein [Cryobacterium sp. PH31-AA6]MDJ0323176.1 hypothetical protein [Cryobacterium sp. PH31-AA6]